VLLKTRFPQHETACRCQLESVITSHISPVGQYHICLWNDSTRTDFAISSVLKCDKMDLNCLLLVQSIFKMFGVYEFLPNNRLMRLLAETLCSHKISRYLCENIVFLISGFDYKQLNVVSTGSCCVAHIHTHNYLSSNGRIARGFSVMAELIDICQIFHFW
jgi:hypothetical protein